MNKVNTESTKASAPTKVIAMSSALVIPQTIPEPTAITRTAVKPFANLPSYFEHTMPTPTQQAIAMVDQVLHKDNKAAGEKGLLTVLTPGGNGEDMTVAPADEATPSAAAGVNLWFGETENGKASPEFEPALSSAPPESGDGNTTHVSPNFPYSSEVDYQSDPADFFSLVSQCFLAIFSALLLRE